MPFTVLPLSVAQFDGQVTPHNFHNSPHL
jgi:hypothetical protein